jgi:hypothetical protein
VPVLVQFEVKDQAGGGGNEAALVFDADLALGENPDLALELFLGPRVHGGKAAALERNHIFPIRAAQLADDQVFLEFFEVDFHERILIKSTEI